MLVLEWLHAFSVVVVLGVVEGFRVVCFDGQVVVFEPLIEDVLELLLGTSILHFVSC